VGPRDQLLSTVRSPMADHARTRLLARWCRHRRCGPGAGTRL